MTSIDVLPNELLVSCFQHLNPHDLCAVISVSHRWQEVGATPALWRSGNLRAPLWISSQLARRLAAITHEGLSLSVTIMPRDIKDSSDRERLGRITHMCESLRFFYPSEKEKKFAARGGPGKVDPHANNIGQFLLRNEFPQLRHLQLAMDEVILFLFNYPDFKAFANIEFYSPILMRKDDGPEYRKSEGDGTFARVCRGMPRLRTVSCPTMLFLMTVISGEQLPADHVTELEGVYFHTDRLAHYFPNIRSYDLGERSASEIWNANIPPPVSIRHLALRSGETGPFLDRAFPDVTSVEVNNWIEPRGTSKAASILARLAGLPALEKLHLKRALYGKEDVIERLENAYSWMTQLGEQAPPNLKELAFTSECSIYIERHLRDESAAAHVARVAAETDGELAAWSWAPFCPSLTIALERKIARLSGYDSAQICTTRYTPACPAAGGWQTWVTLSVRVKKTPGGLEPAVTVEVVRRRV